MAGKNCSFCIVLSAILDMRLEHYRPVFAIIYYVLQKKQKEDLSLILIPASYLILRTILYAETQTEYVTGTISVFLAALLTFALRKRTEAVGKGRIPGFVFYAYYSLHFLVIGLL